MHRFNIQFQTTTPSSELTWSLCKRNVVRNYLELYLIRGLFQTIPMRAGTTFFGGGGGSLVSITSWYKLRAVPFKSVGGGEEERKVIWRGEGPNSELFFPIRLHIISGRRGGGGGGGCRIFNNLPFLPPPPPTTLLNGMALNHWHKSADKPYNETNQFFLVFWCPRSS